MQCFSNKSNISIITELEKSEIQLSLSFGIGLECGLSEALTSRQVSKKSCLPDRKSRDGKWYLENCRSRKFFIQISEWHL